MAEAGRAAETRGAREKAARGLYEQERRAQRRMMERTLPPWEEAAPEERARWRAAVAPIADAAARASRTGSGRVG